MKIVREPTDDARRSTDRDREVSLWLDRGDGTGKRIWLPADLAAALCDMTSLSETVNAFWEGARRQRAATSPPVSDAPVSSVLPVGQVNP